MWSARHGIDTAATPERIWALFADVEGWKAWNAGIEDIVLHGAFQTGSSFFMRPPGDEDGFTSILTRVEPLRGFTDEAVVGGTCVRVHHDIVPTPDGAIRIEYRTEATGPDADRIGTMASADFPQVLEALRNLAERSGGR